MGDTTQDLGRVFVPRKAPTFETLLAENSRLSRQLELEVAARKLAEAARKEFFDDNKRLSRQLEEAREALWDVLKRIAAIGECGVQCPKCVKELHIMKSEAERVLADKEGTKP
jgi:hypothetical protein